MVDTNVSLSRWPFRRLAGDDTTDLVSRLLRANVTQAWAGSFDALLHRDIGGVNARLAEECRRAGAGILVPFGTVNPKLPDWQEDLRRCAEEHRMPGIRLYPNYHRYELTDPVFEELLRRASGHGLIVQIAVSMEDVRTQHPLVRVPVVDVSPLPQLLKAFPALRIVLLNWWAALRGDRLLPFVDARAVYFDISMVEGIEGIARLLERLPAERVVFGSHFPFFPLEASLLKMQESGLPDPKKQMLLEGTAKGILRR